MHLYKLLSVTYLTSRPKTNLVADFDLKLVRFRFLYLAVRRSALRLNWDTYLAAEILGGLPGRFKMEPFPDLAGSINRILFPLAVAETAAPVESSFFIGGLMWSPAIGKHVAGRGSPSESAAG